MDWAHKFYSTTGKWWGPAESKIVKRDFDRAKIIKRLAPQAKTILELGSGYGNTAAACVTDGFDVVAVELSDRADFAKQFDNQKYKESLKFIKDDFYKVQLDQKFDVICYWNGFGIGTDVNQRRLLTRMSQEWLEKDGCVLMDVQNPFVWRTWVGDHTDKKARPEVGYNYNVSEKFDYDPVNNRGIDTWWETDKPEEKLSQDIRCYSPVDLLLLLEGTGLKLEKLEIDNKDIDLTKKYDAKSIQGEESEYLVKLVRS